MISAAGESQRDRSTRYGSSYGRRPSSEIVRWFSFRASFVDLVQSKSSVQVLRRKELVWFPSFAFSSSVFCDGRLASRWPAWHAVPCVGFSELEQEGAIKSEWGVSENNRGAKFYRITKSGQKQLASEVNQWAQATEIVGRFLALKGAET